MIGEKHALRREQDELAQGGRSPPGLLAAVPGRSLALGTWPTTRRAEAAREFQALVVQIFDDRALKAARRA
jgi:hypothetical protein